MMKQKLVYIGLRVLNDKKLAPCFLDLKTKSERSYYSGVKWVHIGEQYETDTSGRMSARPVSLGVVGTEHEIELWTAGEVAAQHEWARIKAAKRAKAEDFSGWTVDKLSKVIQKLPYSERAVFADAIKTRLLYGK